MKSPERVASVKPGSVPEQRAINGILAGPGASSLPSSSDSAALSSVMRFIHNDNTVLHFRVIRNHQTGLVSPSTHRDKRRSDAVFDKVTVSIGADFPGAVGANAPIGKGSVGACTQRKN